MVAGRSTVPCLGVIFTFATIMAKYGKTIAPVAQITSHQPVTKSMATMHAIRIPIAMEYLIMRIRRSSVGASGSDVAD